MKRMLCIAFAVLMLFAGCGSAVNAPNPTERPIAHTTEDPTPIPALEQTPAPTTTASIANEFGCLSIHNIKTGEIISLGDTLEYIVSTIGDPLEYYSNIAFYDSGVFITYERKCVNASDTDIACDFKLFALDGMPCNWELNTGLIAGEYDVQGVINAYGKENGYKLDDELFYMLREDGSTCQAGENDYVVMYGFAGQVITMTLHGLSTDGAETEMQTPNPTQTQINTPIPTLPPVPTQAPTPTPASVPDPVVYTGSGDDVIDVTPPDGIWVLCATGNAAGRHFSIKGYDSNGEHQELFVNTTEPYSGITVAPLADVAMLEINAHGDWTVELVSILEMPIIHGGETITGTGDSVFLTNKSGTTATISGNAESRHFAVISYGLETIDLLVNTTDEYSGTVMLKSAPVFMSVTAVGDWSIKLN